MSVENDDATAERQCGFMDAAGIDPADVIPWNAYPWYINAQPTAPQLREGTEVLRRLIELLPELRLVLLLGVDAQRAWKYFLEEHGQVLSGRGIRVLEAYHPGRQGLWHSDPEVRLARQRSIEQTMTQAADVINGPRTGSVPSP